MILISSSQQVRTPLVETSAQLHDLVESHSRGTTPKASDSGVAGSGGAAGFSTGDHARAQEPDLDSDLEAYLQTIAHEKEEKGPTGGSDSESAADLDEYLNELNDESEKGSEKAPSDEEDAVDVGQFIKDTDEETKHQ